MLQWALIALGILWAIPVCFGAVALVIFAIKEPVQRIAVADDPPQKRAA